MKPTLHRTAYSDAVIKCLLWMHCWIVFHCLVAGGHEGAECVIDGDR